MIEEAGVELPGSWTSPWRRQTSAYSARNTRPRLGSTRPLVSLDAERPCFEKRERGSGAELTAPYPNDTGDVDGGPNGLQNHPLITGVAADGSSVSGELWSTPGGSFLVDLYATSACHSSSHGGGERYLGEMAVTTNATGRGTFTAPTSVGAGELVTSTATTTGGFVDGATSEFSRCAAPGLVATGMTEPAEAGATKIQVGDNDDFEVGDEIIINPGCTNEETTTVGGFGSLILTGPLQRDHEPGELTIVVARAPGPETPPPGPPLPPTPDPAPVVQPPLLSPPPGGTTTGGGGAADALTVLGGEDRVATSIQLSRDSFADDAAKASGSSLHAGGIDSPRQAGAAVLAGAAGFADGLVAAPLAVEEVAPVLLTGRDALDPRVLAEIDRILAPGDRVFVVGGTAAVGPAVVEHLEAAGYEVIRIAGVDRYATSVAVARRLGPPDIVLETTGLDFADALAASAAAHVEGGVVLLTAGVSMPGVVAEYLAEFAGVPRYAVGGPASVADPRATMVAGADRYATAAAVARRFFDDPTVVGVASGESFADALAGAAHIALRGGPLVLVRHAELPSATDAYLRENAAAITEVFIYGGTAAISREAREAAAAVA